MKNSINQEILQNLKFIKEISTTYYKKHNIPYGEPNNSFYNLYSALTSPIIEKRKPETTPCLKRQKYL